LCKKTDELILSIYMLYDVFLCKELSFGSRDDCTCIENFSGIKIAIIKELIMIKKLNP